jgi:hypothetical protein
VSSLSEILRAVDSVREPHEAFGVLIAGAGPKHAIRVIVGGECITHVEATSREEALARALDQIGAVVEAAEQTAFAEAGSW